MENTTGKCLNCNKTITGRSDKKFCDAYCRSAYNNQIFRAEEATIKKVNSIIRRNRKILKQLSPEGKTTIRRTVLEKLNFNFTFFTHHYHTRKGNIYNFCYDYGYLLLPDEKVHIVAYQPYMASLNDL